MVTSQDGRRRSLTQTVSSSSYWPFFLSSASSGRVFLPLHKSRTNWAIVAKAAKSMRAFSSMAITPFEAPPASDLAGDESHSSKIIVATDLRKRRGLSVFAHRGRAPGPRLPHPGPTGPRPAVRSPGREKKSRKIFASRARVNITRARFRMTRMRPRAVACRDGPAKTFTSIFGSVACAAESPQTARAATKEVPRC